MIEASNLARRYGTSLAVADVSFQVAAGELLALVGDSGSGKTTTLKMINRLVEPDAGRVMVEGRDTAGIDPHALRRSIGYVFQGVGRWRTSSRSCPSTSRPTSASPSRRSRPAR